MYIFPYRTLTLFHLGEWVVAFPKWLSNNNIIILYTYFELMVTNLAYHFKTREFWTFILMETANSLQHKTFIITSEDLRRNSYIGIEFKLGINFLKNEFWCRLNVFKTPLVLHTEKLSFHIYMEFLLQKFRTKFKGREEDSNGFIDCFLIRFVEALSHTYVFNVQGKFQVAVC